MKNLRNALCSLILVAAFFAAAPLSFAQQAPQGSTAPASTAPASSPQPAPATTAPAPSSTAAPAATAPATTSAPAVPTIDISGQITDTFATGFLDTLSKTVDALKTNITTVTMHFSPWADFTAWLVLQQEPSHEAFWASVGMDLLIAVGVPLLIGIAAMLFLFPLRRTIRRRAPRTFAGKAGLLISLLVLRLIPLFIFLGTALLLLNQNESFRLPRFVLLNVIYALSLGYTLQEFLRTLFAPSEGSLRLPALSSKQAASAFRWINNFGFLIIFGYFFMDVAAALRMPASNIVFFRNIFAIAANVVAIVAIFRARFFVAGLLSRNVPSEEDLRIVDTLRLWLSQRWHLLATTYLVISLVLMLVGVNYSFALMLRGTILSIIILVVASFSFVMVEKWKAPKSTRPPFLHRQVLAFLLGPFIWLAAALGIAAAWGIDIERLASTPFGHRATSAIISIAITLSVLTLIYETIYNAVERHLARNDKDGKGAASARARTLLPMLRNTVFVIFSAIAFIVFLSAIGINTGPLLAGAGVIGVAIGFGSQSLIKDFLTGLFIVVENTIAVGDFVKIGDFTGVVEALSLRTIRLRDNDGSLHILPFSEVSKITNKTRGYAYAHAYIHVAYNSDPEHVMRVLREVGESLQEDPVFKRVILEPMEVNGLENLDATSLMFQVRIRTRPGKQWDVRRLMLLRIRQRFVEEKIVISPTTIPLQPFSPY